MLTVIDVDKELYDRAKMTATLYGSGTDGYPEIQYAFAIANGTLLPKDCEILTREAYADLCARAAGLKLKEGDD